MELKRVLERLPDPHGRQGRDYRLWSILGLVLVSTRHASETMAPFLWRGRYG
jgi:hypothetical protein